MQILQPNIPQLLDEIYRKESRSIFATLIRLLGDFDLAEDAMHDAFKVALEQWPEKGVPLNPMAWLVSTGRFKAIDRVRRQARFNPLQLEQIQQLEADISDPSEQVDKRIDDDMLRLIFTCCHPDLAPDARVALTLREVCGLTTEEIARAFLTKPATLAQRIVRAKAKIRETNIPFEVPPEHELPNRLNPVLQVIYLVFNEGYYASSGESVTRVDLSGEAIRLGRLLHILLPIAEVTALLGLMLLHESRRKARTTSTGDLILLDDQDRSLWNRDMIEEGLILVSKAHTSNQADPYTIQAAIATIHAKSKSPDDTDWSQISELYKLLIQINPTPVIELNYAVATAMHKGPEVGLNLIDAILNRGELNDYHLAHSARTELCRKIGRTNDARISWERALTLVQLDPERRFIKRKLEELDTKTTKVKNN